MINDQDIAAHRLAFADSRDPVPDGWTTDEVRALALRLCLEARAGSRCWRKCPVRVAGREVMAVPIDGRAART